MATTAPTRAAALLDRYLDLLRDHEPVTWTRIGGSGRDGDLPEVGSDADAARSRDLARLGTEVRAARDAVPRDATGEDREARDDLMLLAEELEYRRFLVDVRPRYATDPLAALEAVASGLHELLRRRDLPREEQVRRLSAAVARARAVPSFLEQAGRALVAAPAPHLEVAIARLDGLCDLLRDQLPARANALGVDPSDACAAGAVGVEGVEAFGALLDELRGEVPAPWRLGPDHHEVMLRSALGAALPPAEIADRARAWLDTVRTELAELAAAGWSRRFPGEPVPADEAERVRRSLRHVARTAVSRDELVAEARRAVVEARAFAETLGLGDLPPAERLTVTEVPSYLAGIAVAFISQAPPLDPSGGCVYYLSPVPDSWDDDRAASFLREYTPAQLRSLALHEGYPGHFVQLEHASHHPRLARRLLTRPAFAEGWAIHVEREAVRAGFGDGATSAVEGDDYRLTQRKLELRIATNALLDVGLHTGDLDDDGAMALLKDGAFQEDAEARGKLTRAKVTSGQLCSYFVGGAELADLHEEVRDREGAAFDTAAFHQRLLSHGTPTVDVVRRALADDAPVRRPFA
ncbi:DUF885 domain-containing protein [Nitriliruptor alkaliphilus]|uniref:DUF885 domain-containing protein n=1 Tax=Nitriliruptor alkaliphilus TaxID=427918 RepID=UPI000698BA27|nr:DUF885 domain-containing protein [Nitriliruptor alkaliphilus]